MPHTLDLNRLQEIFERIEANSELLNKWEQGFFTDVYDQWTSTDRPLTEPQLEKLEQCFNKVP